MQFNMDLDEPYGTPPEGVECDYQALASAYSYECKVCTVRRIVETRKKTNPYTDWNYPDW